MHRYMAKCTCSQLFCLRQTHPRTMPLEESKQGSRLAKRFMIIQSCFIMSFTYKMSTVFSLHTSLAICPLLCNFFTGLPVNNSQSQLTTDPTSTIEDLPACFQNTFMVISSTSSLGCRCFRRSSYILVAN